MPETTPLSAEVDKLSINEQTNSEAAPSELVAVVDDLLNQLNSKFNNLSADLIVKMDEMSQRLDHLEANIRAENAQDDGEINK